MKIYKNLIQFGNIIVILEVIFIRRNAFIIFFIKDSPNIKLVESLIKKINPMVRVFVDVFLPFIQFYNINATVVSFIFEGIKFRGFTTSDCFVVN